MLAARASILLLLLMPLGQCDDGDTAGPVPDSSGGNPGCPDGGTYPCGPYGTAAGQVAANLTFNGYMDPDFVCKTPDKQQNDVSALRQLSLDQWHQLARTCATGPGRSLLWISVGAGWCPACSAEALDQQTMIKDGTLDPRVAVMGVLFETKTRGQAVDAPFLKAWIETYKLTYPVVMDPGFKMGAYYDARETPFNMLVDLSSMKILHRHTGSNTASMLNAIKKHIK